MHRLDVPRHVMATGSTAPTELDTLLVGFTSREEKSYNAVFVYSNTVFV